MIVAKVPVYSVIWNKPGNRTWNKEFIWRRSRESLARSHFNLSTGGALGSSMTMIWQFNKLNRVKTESKIKACYQNIRETQESTVPVNHQYPNITMGS